MNALLKLGPAARNSHCGDRKSAHVLRVEGRGGFKWVSPLQRVNEVHNRSIANTSQVHHAKKTGHHHILRYLYIMTLSNVLRQLLQVDRSVLFAA